jgi:glycosyltransferase involved in cell wall biosynthesis
MIDLSVVFPTANRLPYLKRCIESVRANIGDLSYEFVIVDGGSTDGTAEYLAKQPDVKFIQHGALLGSNKAFRDCFLASSGEYVCQLSDDIEIVDGCLQAAIAVLRTDESIGQMAFYFQHPDGYPTLPLTIVGSQKVIFTAFGVTPRAVGELVDWWSPEYYQQYGDPDFTNKIREAGYQIVPLEGYCVLHYSAERDAALKQRNREDGKIYADRWMVVDE